MTAARTPEACQEISREYAARLLCAYSRK